MRNREWEAREQGEAEDRAADARALEWKRRHCATDCERSSHHKAPCESEWSKAQDLDLAEKAAFDRQFNTHLPWVAKQLPRVGVDPGPEEE